MLSKIVLKNILKNYNVDVILNDLSFEFYQGRSYAIIGASGSGKSTLLMLLAGLEKPNQGNVVFNNRNVNDFTNQQRSSFHTHNVGLVFQTPYLIQDLTILENTMLPALIAGNSWQESSLKAQEMLARVGISDKANSIPFKLSGGQQQRATLARALMNNPSFLLADEPTGNLDKQTGQNILELLLLFKKEQKMGLILTTHDHNLVHQMDTVLELKNGNLKAYQNQEIISERTIKDSLTI